MRTVYLLAGGRPLAGEVRRGALRGDAGPALRPSEATQLVPALRRRELVVCTA